MQKIKTDVPKDISLAEAGKYGSLTDFAFFDKVASFIQSFNLSVSLLLSMSVGQSVGK